MKKYRLLSLFSGCGGMDLGFEGGFLTLKRSINENMHPSWIKEDYGNYVRLEERSFKTVFANDIREDAKRAWVNYFEKHGLDNANEIYQISSIVDLVKMAKESKYSFPSDIDIVTGGFPCQDFSVSGKRAGFNSEKSHMGVKLKDGEPQKESRGQLYLWMKEVVSITKPKVFIAENVKGLVNLNDAKEKIEKDFSTAASSSYLVVPAKVLYAPNFGVPQSRERVFFFGFKKDALRYDALNALSSKNIIDEYNPYPKETHKENELVTCKEALIDLLEPEFSSDKAQKAYSKAKYMTSGQGQSEIKLNSIGPTIRSEHHGNIEFRRLSLDHGGKNICELEKGLKERRLTVRECARLQTFPDDYEFILEKKDRLKGVSSSDAYKIIGNAVPPVLAYNIAANLEEKWDRYFK